MYTSQSVCYMRVYIIQNASLANIVRFLLNSIGSMFHQWIVFYCNVKECVNSHTILKRLLQYPLIISGIQTDIIFLLFPGRLPYNKSNIYNLKLRSSTKAWLRFTKVSNISICQNIMQLVGRLSDNLTHLINLMRLPQQETLYNGVFSQNLF